MRSTLRDIMTQILCKEDVCKLILRLQCLDVLLDVEGCHAVYLRYCSILESDSGDSSAARNCSADFHHESLLRDIDALDNDHECWQQMCFFADAGLALVRSDELNTVSTEMWSWLRELVDLAVVNSSGSDTDREEEDKYARSLQWVDCLDRRQCAILLRFWLIALSAKDVSVMVSIQCLCECASSSEDALTDKFFIDWNGQRFMYTIGLVDIGPKSISKVSSKVHEEVDICEKSYEYVKECGL